MALDDNAEILQDPRPIGNTIQYDADGYAIDSVTDGGGVVRLAVDSDISSLPLPSGAATEVTLSSIDTKTPVLGQTTMSGSSPVAIASDQSAIPVTDNGGSLTVDGSVSVSNFPAVQSVDDNGGSLTVDATSWPLPTGAATEATLATRASETTAAAIETNTDNLDVLLSTRATEATLATMLTELEFETRIGEVTASPTANTVLGRLKDISDDLNARLGTLGQKPMTSSTPVVIASDQSNVNIDLHDGYSLPISSIENNTINRLETRTSITNPDGTETVYTIENNEIIRLETRSSISGPDGVKTVTVIDDADTPADKRLQVEADFKPGATLQVTTGATASTGTVSEYLLNGGSEDMVVNGSGTPVIFSYAADTTDGYDILLTSLRLVFSASFFEFSGATFGKGGGALSTGVCVDIVADDGVFDDQLAVLNVNEDFLRLLDFSISQAGATDVLAASLPFGGRVILEGGTADNITVTVRDNLTIGARGINYFTATLYGVLEDNS